MSKIYLVISEWHMGMDGDGYAIQKAYKNREDAEEARDRLEESQASERETEAHSYDYDCAVVEEVDLV